MKLYHYTLERYAALIRENGIYSIGAKRRAGLYPANFRPAPEQFPGEDELVWLTKCPNTNAGIVSVEPVYRVTVEGIRAIKWKDYPGVPPQWRKTLNESALHFNSNNYARDWYVVKGIVPAHAITEIIPLSDVLGE